ncbi:MAG: DUF2007 domain-containing protein, partial [Holophagales bacterium]|nr:DUF2007 domain-containing protein [Holophagales bacterium]
LLRRGSEYSLVDAQGNSIRSTLPALPQSVLPIVGAYWLVNLPAALAMLRGQVPGEPIVGPTAHLVGLAVAVPALGLAALHLFSSRARLERNLPSLAPAEGFRTLLGRRFWQTTAVFTSAVVFLGALELYVYAGSFFLGVVEIVLVVAVVMDLLDEYRFHRRSPDVEVLAELDNVHLAHLVETHLSERGIPCGVKALRFRSLLFFLGPIYKMSVLVASDRLDEARKILESWQPRIA